jgi:Arc/MetJ-type ribon-helix-helix transcriptional regulator
MTITLSPETQRRLEEQMQRGGYASPDQVILAGIELLEQHDRQGGEYIPEIQRLATFEQNWDGLGSEPPDKIALARANQLAAQSTAIGMKPARVMACANGGVTLLFDNADRQVVIDCFNSGEIVIATTSSVDPTTADEVCADEESIREALQNARQFLRR